MKKLLILGVIITGIIATGFWYYSAENIVVRKSNKLTECFEKSQGDGLLSNVLSEDTFRDLLDKKVALDFDHDDMPDMKGGIKQDRDHLARNYLYMMKSAKYITLTDLNIDLLSIEEESATVKVKTHAEVKHNRSKLNSDINLILDYKKTNEGWRISGIKVQKKD